MARCCREWVAAVLLVLGALRGDGWRLGGEEFVAVVGKSVQATRLEQRRSRTRDGNDNSNSSKSQNNNNGNEGSKDKTGGWRTRAISLPVGRGDLALVPDAVDAYSEVCLSCTCWPDGANGQKRLSLKHDGLYGGGRGNQWRFTALGCP